MLKKRKILQIHIYSKGTDKPEFYGVSIRVIFGWLVGLAIIVVGFVFWLPSNMINLKNFRVLDISKEQRSMQATAGKLEKRIAEANTQIENGRNLREKTNILAGISNSEDKGEEAPKAKSYKGRRTDTDLSRIQKTTETFRKVRDALIENEQYARSLPLLHPIKERQKRTNKFGLVHDPLTKREIPHRGLDFAVKEGDTIIATGDGIVENITTGRTGFGTTLEIQHAPHIKTHYSHLQSVLVQPGKPVKKGQAVALAGKSGSVLWPVLHYEVRYDNQPINPDDYFITQ
ncbi:MAG: M23 family metallopeptidase [Fibromonadales bacterium]|nr:M23 family metallopeptidase [Fibromonadales bacterium]